MYKCTIFFGKKDCTIFNDNLLKISKAKNYLPIKLSSQKHVSFVSIVCLFSYLVCVT